MTIWISGLLIFAAIVLLVLYSKGYFEPSKTYRFKNFPTSDTDKFLITVASLSDSFIESGDILDFRVGADEIFPARLEAIKKAQFLIQLETYIATPGRRADELAETLIKKVHEGVKVQLLMDNYGTKEMPDSYWEKLRKEGIEVRKFNPLDWRNIFKNLKRSHRKLLIIDNELALVGGAGISDMWDGWEEIGDEEPWLDYEVAMKGSILTNLSGIFWQHWLDTGGVTDLDLFNAHEPKQSDRPILMTVNDSPSYQDSSVRALFQTLIMGSTKRFWIASPYFLPNSNSCQILRDAQKRGVDVKIITMGKHCDKNFVRLVARERYDRLLKSQISIYEHQPSMMHAKIILIDDNWVSFGSANFDPRSFFLNDELNLSTSNAFLIEEVEKFFLKGLSQSKQITIADWQKRSFSDRLKASFYSLFYEQL